MNVRKILEPRLVPAPYKAMSYCEIRNCWSAQFVEARPIFVIGIGPIRDDLPVTACEYRAKGQLPVRTLIGVKQHGFDGDDIPRRVGSIHTHPPSRRRL